MSLLHLNKRKNRSYEYKLYQIKLLSSPENMRKIHLFFSLSHYHSTLINVSFLTGDAPKEDQKNSVSQERETLSPSRFLFTGNWVIN